VSRIERLKAADLVDPQPSASERAKKNQHWPKDQRASETPHSHEFVSRAYEHVLVLEAMPSRFRGLMSVFGVGLLGAAAFSLFASGTILLQVYGHVLAARIGGWGIFFGLLLAIGFWLLFLIAFIAAIRTFRIDLLAPKEIPLVFNRKTRKVYRYAQDIPGFEQMMGANGKFSLLGVGRYIVSTFRPWPNMILVEYEWDCLEAEYYSITALAGNVVRTDDHLELYVREAPGGDKVIGAFALVPSILAGEAMGKELWEHVRRFMEENGPALSPGDQPAPPPPQGFWQAVIESLGQGIVCLAGIAWTWNEVYWNIVFFSTDPRNPANFERLNEIDRHLHASPAEQVLSAFVIFISYIGMGWTVFGILASYLSPHAELPDELIREAGAPVDLKALAAQPAG
jgi:hypothetical protein